MRTQTKADGDSRVGGEERFDPFHDPYLADPYPFFAEARAATPVFQAVEIGGVLVPAEANLLLLLGSANRDPAVFEDPEDFDIHRQNAKERLSLGFGAHYCLGAPLVRLEARIVLGELSARLPSLRLIPGQTLRFQPNTTFRGPLSLLVEWDT